MRKRRVQYPAALLRKAAAGGGCRALPCGIDTFHFTPHFNIINYNRKYFIAIPKNSIKGEINGIPFDGLPADMWEAEWTFTTKAPPELLLSQPLTVNCNPEAKADFCTIYGAMLAVCEKSGEWTISAVLGIYRELIHYNGTADITINGMTNNPLSFHWQ